MDYSYIIYTGERKKDLCKYLIYGRWKIHRWKEENPLKTVQYQLKIVSIIRWKEGGSIDGRKEDP